MNWNLSSQLSLTASRKDGRTLNIALVRVMAEGWVGIAVESANVDPDKPAVESIAATLDSHAHAQLPTCVSLADATKQAEKYAKWWQRTGATHEECPCDVVNSTIGSTGCDHPQIAGASSLDGKHHTQVCQACHAGRSSDDGGHSWGTWEDFVVGGV